MSVSRPATMIPFLSKAQLALDRVLPASLYHADTGYALLSEMEGIAGTAGSSPEAAGRLQELMPRLLRGLQHRMSPDHAAAVTLKAANVLLARRHMQSREAHLIANPIGLVIDPSNMCQLACPGCVHSESSGSSDRFLWPKGTMTQDLFGSLMQRYGLWAVAVYFCDYGEPLLNRRTPEMIRLAKQYRMHAMLSTSLSVRHFDASAYVSSGLDLMVLSVDGATQSTYERFRRNGNLELVLENIRTLVKARQQLGRHLPLLSWNYLAFEHNVHEIPAAIEMARSLGVDKFRVVRPFDVSWDDPEIRPADVPSRVLHLNWRGRLLGGDPHHDFPHELAASQFEEALRSPWDLSSPESPGANTTHTCHWLYKNLVVDATGRVMPCCAAPSTEKKLVFAEYNGHGNPWNSPMHRAAREFFRHGSDPADLEIHCTRCEWDQTNVNIGSREIDRYFRQADPVYFDSRTRRFLADW